MNYKLYQKIFVHILHENDLYNKFYYNFTHFKGWSDSYTEKERLNFLYGKESDSMLFTLYLDKMIRLTFHWSETKEGYNFWNDTIPFLLQYWRTNKDRLYKLKG